MTRGQSRSCNRATGRSQAIGHDTIQSKIESKLPNAYGQDATAQLGTTQGVRCLVLLRARTIIDSSAPKDACSKILHGILTNPPRPPWVLSIRYVCELKAEAFRSSTSHEKGQ